jgi:O-antigen/teichoic acid export membrane protein
VFKRSFCIGGESRAFLRKAAIVASGQAIGYALALGASPILSRLYGPGEFGILAVFVTLTSVMGTICTLRYDNAIPLPKDERTAELLTSLAKAALAVTILGLMIVAAIFGSSLNHAIFGSNAAPFTWMLVAAVAAYAACEIHIAQTIRRGNFAELSRMRVAQAVTCLATQLCVPVMFVAGPVGLLVGQIAGYIGEFIIIGLMRDGQARRPVRADIRELRRVALEYRSYPMFDVSSTLLRVFAVNGQLLIIAWMYGAAAAGFLALAQRLLATPISMIGFSISRVYYSEAAALTHDGPAALQQLFISTLKRLTWLSAPPLAIVCLLAPAMFGFVFGTRWQTAGIYCSFLCPLVFLRVVSFVLGPTLDVIHRQGLRLVREMTCVALISAGLLCAHLLNWSEMMAIATSTALGSLGYSISIVLTWKALVAHQVAADEIAPAAVPSKAA